ncbi:Isochorismatase-like protein [Geopyxis carbonaria]|nr:Isochorismatase-like protein [Geopyxis carbonaria]
MTPPPPDFRPALIVVDLQEDFWPPNGALSVPSGHDVIEPINTLLSLPFSLRVATKDWHPSNHVSFAANHPPPNNTPFQSTTLISHPGEPKLSYETLLWPVHCVQDTPGAELIQEFDQTNLDAIVEKGANPHIEMYSAFTDPFHKSETTPWSADSTSICTTELPMLLKDKRITDVYVVGLAMDYCVRSTAEHAVAFGYRTYVVREGTRAVGGAEGEKSSGEAMEKAGVTLVGMQSDEVEWVRNLKG